MSLTIQHNPVFLNVKDYSATGNGTISDSSAVLAAHAAITPVIGNDSFVKANQSPGWGTDTTGQSWVQVPTSANLTLAISSNEGTSTGNGSEPDTVVLLGTTTATNSEILVRLQTGSGNALNTMGVCFRYSDINNYYRVIIDGESSGTLYWQKIVAGTKSTIVSVPGLSGYSQTTYMWLHVIMNGTTCQVRAFADGVGEPSSWLINATDTGLPNAGQYGVATWQQSGTSSLDHFMALDLSRPGGVLYFPPGIFRVKNLPVSPLVGYVGAGNGITTLKLENSANVDLFSAQTNLINPAASSGTGSAGLVYDFRIANMTLDGNRANQSSGTSYPLRVYGYDYTLENLEVKNGYSGNILADWNVFNTFASNSMEARWTNIKTHDSGGIGIQFGGPHDSQFMNIIPFNEASHCLHVTTNAYGSQFSQVHAWQPGSGRLAILCEANGATYWSNCQAESSDTVQVAALSTGFVWDGGNIFGASPFTCSGIQIGQQGGQTPYAGQMRQSGGVTQAYNPTNCRVNGRISNCAGTNGALWLANDGGANVFDITVDQGSGTGLTGTIANSTQVRLNTFGLTPDGSIGKGGGFRIASKSNPGFTVSDGTNDLFRVETEFNHVDVNNNASFNLYSDTSFSTLVSSLNYDGQGAISTATFYVSGESATAPVTASSGTIATTVGESRVAPTGNITGVILQAGAHAAQYVSVVNESAFTITFATAATSNVADGTSDVIIANTARDFRWNSVKSLWYPVK